MKQSTRKPIRNVEIHNVNRNIPSNGTTSAVMFIVGVFCLLIFLAATLCFNNKLCVETLIVYPIGMAVAIFLDTWFDYFQTELENISPWACAMWWWLLIPVQFVISSTKALRDMKKVRLLKMQETRVRVSEAKRIAKETEEEVEDLLNHERRMGQ